MYIEWECCKVAICKIVNSNVMCCIIRVTKVLYRIYKVMITRKRYQRVVYALCNE